MSRLHAAWLLTRLYLIRTRNILTASQKPDGQHRTGTAPKRQPGASWLLVAFAWSFFLLVAITFAHFMLDNISTANGVDEADRVRFLTAPRWPAPPPPKPARPAPGHGEPDAVLRAFALLVALAMTVALHGLLMALDLSRVEWSLEWFFTLPLGVTALFAVRTVASAVTNVAGYFFLAPLLGTMAWRTGWRYGAVVLALLLSAILLVFVSAARQIIDVLLRQRFNALSLRNVQGVLTIAGFVLWFVPFAFVHPGSHNYGHPVWEFTRSVPALIDWTPPGLAARIVACVDPARFIAYLALLVLECVALCDLAFAFLERRLAGGLLAGAAHTSVRGVARPLPPARARRFLTVFQTKLVRMLARDVNMAFVAFFVPALTLIALVAVPFVDLTLVKSTLSTPQVAGAALFTLIAFVIHDSLPEVLFKEFETFWFLTTFPRRPESLFLECVAFWCVALAPVPIAGLAVCMRAIPAPPLTWLWIATLVFAGLVLFTLTSTTLIILHGNPFATRIEHKLSPAAAYIYFALAGVYAHGIASGEPFQVLGAITLAVMLACALWQKATDHLPYVLDPSALPPPRLSLADGLIAVQIFFMLQGLLPMLHPGTFSDPVLTFASAGGATCLLVLLTIWHQKMAGIPRVAGPGALRAVGEGLFFGGLAGLCGVAYLHLCLAFPALREAMTRSGAFRPVDALLMIVAAPLCEELIFRGLVYGGMRRTLPVVTSVLASALLFAVVHPPVSLVPVFVMAVCAAIVFERTGLLLGPILVHATYNAAVFFAQAP